MTVSDDSASRGGVSFATGVVNRSWRVERRLTDLARRYAENWPACADIRATDSGTRRSYGRVMTSNPLLQELSDQALLEKAEDLAHHERIATAELIAALAEIDERKLYLGQGCSSMFAYCTRVLHLSEHAAYDRIEAARLGREFPVVLDRLRCGALTLTNLRLLAPLLNGETIESLLDQAAHKSKHEVEALVGSLRAETAADTETYTIHVTLSGETLKKLRSAQELLRHTIPDGDIGKIVDRGLTLLLRQLEKQKVGSSRLRASKGPSRLSRHIPLRIRREVWKRDGGQCAFVGDQGRCRERGFLEFHHVEPYAVGGNAIADNLQLRCRAHNQYEAEMFFGPRESPSPVENRPG